MTVLATAPARHPHCEFTIGTTTTPGIVIEWQKIMDANGYTAWHARVLFWDGEPRVVLVPATRVRAVG